ncbi:MAG: hypothetical protein RL885_20320 [Planctomycetota bacterium]
MTNGDSALPDSEGVHSPRTELSGLLRMGIAVATAISLLGAVWIVPDSGYWYRIDVPGIYLASSFLDWVHCAFPLALALIPAWLLWRDRIDDEAVTSVIALTWFTVALHGLTYLQFHAPLAYLGTLIPVVAVLNWPGREGWKEAGQPRVHLLANTLIGTGIWGLFLFAALQIVIPWGSLTTWAFLMGIASFGLVAWGGLLRLGPPLWPTDPLTRKVRKVSAIVIVAVVVITVLLAATAQDGRARYQQFQDSVGIVFEED